MGRDLFSRVQSFLTANLVPLLICFWNYPGRDFSHYKVSEWVVMSKKSLYLYYTNLRKLGVTQDTRFFLNNMCFLVSFWPYLQLFTKYSRLTLVFMWNSTLREYFNFCFSREFLLVLAKFPFWQEDWALGYHSLKFEM